MSNLSSGKSPNQEQIKAITNKSGMTLSAGAGAGKTYVLVEHLIFRLDNLYENEFRGNWNELSTKKIQENLLKIILITFTRKASGELLTRIRERVVVKISSLSSDHQIMYWKCIEDNLHLVFVSTIHSFCQKILTQKSIYVPVQEINIVDDVIYQHKIKKIFESFLAINHTNIPLNYLLFSADVEKCLKKIFCNVESRINWANSAESLGEENLYSNMFVQISEVLNVGKVWDFVPVEIAESKKPKKWMEALVEYNRVCEKYEGVNNWSLDILQEVFEISKSFKKSSFAEASSLQLDVLDKLINLKNNKKLKPFLESTQSYVENKEFVHGLYKFIREAFVYVESNFYRDGAIGFNDLEYLIIKYLNNDESKQILDRQFDLIVVDEYQDTSNTQFNILSIITNGNFSKIVAVGDLKQAIYGFRGGEIEVFAKTQKLVETNLNLSCNYRSKQKIIKFNNEFFEYIFPLGTGFEKSDRFSFKFEGQIYPGIVLSSTDAEAGKIHIQKVRIENAIKPSSAEIKKIEAANIAEQIELLINNESFRSIAVLYRKLSGSEFLIEELQRRKIKFSAQTKLQVKDEPMYLMVRTLLDYLMLDGGKDFYLQASLRKSIEVLSLFEIDMSTDALVRFLIDFKNTYMFWGIRFAFEDVFFQLGISDSRHTEMWSQITALIEISNGSLAALDTSLKKISDEMTSTTLEAVGKGPGVQIMTVHASKGLEFDAVFVAGIHTNGKSPINREKIGEEFLSLSWKLKKSDRTECKTPWMILEQYRKKEIEFSESKRLFYVACTRAKSDLFFQDCSYLKEGNFEDVVIDSNSWITGLRQFLKEKSFNDISYSEKKISHKSSLMFNDDFVEEDFENSNENEDAGQAPPFHKSNLGIRINKRSDRLGVVGEMSVTKLSEIVECPRKFYFNSVLKINNTDLVFDSGESYEEIAYTPVSSKERGTELHNKIYLHLQGKLKSLSITPEILWVCEELQKIKLQNVYIEKEMKFSFFGQMIAGTPDWFSIDNVNKKIVVVDYKTGTLTDEKILKYNAQVLIYAFGIMKSYSLTNSFNFDLKLFFIDERKIHSRKLNASEIELEAQNIWIKINQLNQVRIDHCKFCNYQSYCREEKK